jgi:hypothetical protein
MDWTSFTIALLIGLYGWSEYRRREEVHRSRLADLRRGIAPSMERPRPELWRLLTTGMVLLLLLLFTGWLWLMDVKSGKIFGAYGQVGAFFSCLLLLTLAMFINLTVRYMRKG